jgi:hypothetical protein
LSLPVPSTTSWRAEIDGKEILRDDRDRWNFQGYLAEGAERYRVSILLCPDGESFHLVVMPPKERSIRNNLAAVRDYAVLGSRRIESRRNCGVIPYAQHQFCGSDDSANQDPRRSKL